LFTVAAIRVSVYICIIREACFILHVSRYTVVWPVPDGTARGAWLSINHRTFSLQVNGIQEQKVPDAELNAMDRRWMVIQEQKVRDAELNAMD
jgi:hypothetical protein